MSQFSLQLMDCPSEEALTTEINKQLDIYKGRLNLFVGFQIAKEDSGQPADADQQIKMQLFGIEPIPEGEQLMKLLSRWVFSN